MLAFDQTDACDADSVCAHVTYIWRGLALPQLAAGLPVGLLSMVTGVSLDEGDIVVVGAGGSGQDPHEVTVVAEVLKQTRHPPEHTHTGPVRLSSPHWFLHWEEWYQCRVMLYLLYSS